LFLVDLTENHYEQTNYKVRFNEYGNYKLQEIKRYYFWIDRKKLSTPFDFSADEKKKEAHWGRDKNLRDVLIHLYGWHQLLLNWRHSNLAGTETTFIPAPSCPLPFPMKTFPGNCCNRA